MSESRTAGACKAFYAKHNSRLNLDGIVQDRLRLGNMDLQEPRLTSVSSSCADMQFHFKRLSFVFVHGSIA